MSAPLITFAGRAIRVCGPTTPAALLLLLCLFAPPASAADARRPEEVKAAFLFNFTRFVEWPSNAFDNAASPFIIAIAGNEAVAMELESMVKNEKIRNRPVQIRSCRRPRDAEGCHLLYVGTAQRVRDDEFLEIARGRPVLTVGDTADFLREGGIIQFVIDRTIRLRIHLRNAREAKLTLSSQLLRLADVENQ